MNKYFNIYSKRINRINLVIILFGFFILSKYLLVQLNTNKYLDNIINNHGYKYREILGNRGKILDSNNNELAHTINKYTLWINPSTETNSEKIIAILSRAFNKNKTHYLNNISKNKKYNVLEKNINDSQFNKLIQYLDTLKASGLNIESKRSRIYKYNNFASQTIGFINQEGKGITGIEKKYNNLLSGDTLMITLKKGAKGNYFNQEMIENNYIDGFDIQLTIDIEIQKIIQEEIKKMVVKSKAKSGNGILINPHNGNILAMASIPDFNPNSYNQYNIESYNNRVISDSYEPGSTLKIVPLALSIELEDFSLSDSIYCEQGEFILASNKKLHDHDPHGNLTLEDIMAFSSNIGFAKISDSFTNKDLYRYLKYFGFGTKTFISLNNESKGFIRNSSDWSITSKNYISIGQELSITNLQLALAYSAIANGGMLIKPNIIKKIIKETKNGNIIQNNSTYPIRQIISTNTSKQIMKSLNKVVETGTGKELNMNNYKVSGKTGTAQKYIDGEYSNYTSTFVTLFPNDYPQYVLVVSIDEPEYGYHWASKSAVPVSKEIITRMMISDNDLHYKLAKKNIVVENIDSSNFKSEINLKSDKNIFPNLIGKSFKEARQIAAKHSITLVPQNNILTGVVISQSIKVGNKIKPGMVCNIKMKML